jgi:uncharacterized protein YndB with AHSA1/START domain
MSDGAEPPESPAPTLVVRRTIGASPERVFEAWTLPEHLLAWWGPRPVRCSAAEVDLRVGGRYRIENELPDGTRVSIEGEFRTVDPPRLLVYTWKVGAEPPSQVTVRFELRGLAATEVVIVHERIATSAIRDSHTKGWAGCLDGLALHFVSGR